jgi:hypothetical protein
VNWENLRRSKNESLEGGVNSSPAFLFISFGNHQLPNQLAFAE